MVSGLDGREYEDRLSELGLTTLEERRHQMDMAEVYKIVTGKGCVSPSEWFEMAETAPRPTRAAADPLNVRIKHGRLDIRKHFFSVRVCENWNKVPGDIKRLKTADSFKKTYARHRLQNPTRGAE